MKLRELREGDYGYPKYSYELSMIRTIKNQTFGQEILLSKSDVLELINLLNNIKK